MKRKLIGKTLLKQFTKTMAFNIWPIAEASLSGERVRIHDSAFKELEINGIPGSIKSYARNNIEVLLEMDV